MSSFNKKDWVNVLDTGQSDICWAFRKYQCPKYMFAGEYSRGKVKEDILKSHRIKDAIEKYSHESGCSETAAIQEASSIIDEISHAFDLKTIRFFALFLMRIFRSLYQQVLINKDGIEMFKESARLTPIVLVPTHNSYFDFLLASAICFALDLPLPAIASGQDFLHVTLVNHLLRGSGAFYMRRSFASDSFYRNIFTEYVQRILCSGERPIEFFVEGTRSRCGKALQPKLGFLAMILESFFHGFVQDVTFIPMSICYEKATEEQLYLYELLGIPKPKESLSGLLKSRSILNTDFGSVFVKFGKPMSLREYCYSKVDSGEYISIPRCERHLRIFGRGLQEMKIAKYFGHKIVYTQQNNTTIFPRSVVACLVLGNPDMIFNLDELSYQVDSIGRLLVNVGCNVYGFKDLLINKECIRKSISYSDYVLTLDNDKLHYTCSSLGESLNGTDLRKITSDTELISRALGYIYLSCQRNKLLHGCLVPSILVQTIKTNCTIEDCKNSFEFIVTLFNNEFIFDPDQDVEQMFSSACQLLSDLQIITISDEAIILNEEKNQDIDFLCSLLQPFLDGYMVVVQSLLTCSYKFPASFKSMSSSLQLQAANLIASSKLRTYESLSLHTLSNVITSFSKSGLLATIKDEKFATLVNGVNVFQLQKTKSPLLPLVSETLRMHLNDFPSKL